MKQSALARIESDKGGKTRGDTFARLASAMSLTVDVGLTHKHLHKTPSFKTSFLLSKRDF